MPSPPPNPSPPADERRDEEPEIYRIPPVPAEHRTVRLPLWDLPAEDPAPSAEAPPAAADSEVFIVTEFLPDEEDDPVITAAPVLIDPDELGEIELDEVELVEVELLDPLESTGEESPATPVEAPPPEPAQPPRQLVLIGAGRTHLAFLKDWRRQPLPLLEVTLITAFDRTIDPAFIGTALAGQAEPAALELDLVKWCAACGIRLIVDRVNGVNPDSRTIQMAHHPDLPFDAASLNLGSVPVNEPLWQARRMLISIKPRPTFLQRFEDRFQELLQQNRSAPQPRLQQIAIVGGGATGVELALCLEERINNEYLPCEVRIVEAGPLLVADLLPRTRKKLGKVLHLRGIHVHPNAEVSDYDDQGAARLVLNDGTTLPADLVIWAAGTAPPAVLKGFSLPKSERGFLSIRPSRQTIADAPVLVMGESVALPGGNESRLTETPAEQARLLRENLTRLLNQQPLVASRFPRQRLTLISCGDGTAFWDQGRFAFYGSWCGWWKSWRDWWQQRSFRVASKSPATPIKTM